MKRCLCLFPLWSPWATDSILVECQVPALHWVIKGRGSVPSALGQSVKEGPVPTGALVVGTEEVPG